MGNRPNHALSSGTAHHKRSFKGEGEVRVFVEKERWSTTAVCVPVITKKVLHNLPELDEGTVASSLTRREKLLLPKVEDNSARIAEIALCALPRRITARGVEARVEVINLSGPDRDRTGLVYRDVDAPTKRHCERIIRWRRAKGGDGRLQVSIYVRVCPAE